jgi:hypothetical protein
MLIPAPPALVQAQPAPARLMDALAEALEAAPEALTDRRPARVHAATRKVLALWDRHREAILAALPGADRGPFGKAMDILRPAQGDAAGLDALDAMAILEHRLPEGRLRWLAAADRQAMRAWILLGEGGMEVPDLTTAFRPLVDQDGGGHPVAVGKTRSELARFQAARSREDRPAAQQSAGVLLDLVDAFEQPAGH